MILDVPSPNRKLARNGLRGNCFPGLRAPELLVATWLEAGRLFEDIQESSRAIDSIALRVAYPFYDVRTF
jgi:hypothetical protein